MLADALVERYSRQILLPEVGGRGQERICASRVTVTGSDEAATTATDLVRAAGAIVTGAPGPAGTLAADAGGAHVVARWQAGGARIALLVGRPCESCLPADALALFPPGMNADASPVAAATGALVAMEVLRAILGLADTGRIHTLDPTRGTFAGAPLEGPVCVRCRSAA